MNQPTKQQLDYAFNGFIPDGNTNDMDFLVNKIWEMRGEKDFDTCLWVKDTAEYEMMLHGGGIHKQTTDVIRTQCGTIISWDRPNDVYCSHCGKPIEIMDNE